MPGKKSPSRNHRTVKPDVKTVNFMREGELLPPIVLRDVDTRRNGGNVAGELEIPKARPKVRKSDVPRTNTVFEQNKGQGELVPFGQIPDKHPPVLHHSDDLGIHVPAVDKTGLIQPIVARHPPLLQKRALPVQRLLVVKTALPHHVPFIEDAISVKVERNQDLRVSFPDFFEDPPASQREARINPKAFLAVGKQQMRMRLVPPRVPDIVRPGIPKGANRPDAESFHSEQLRIVRKADPAPGRLDEFRRGEDVVAARDASVDRSAGRRFVPLNPNHIIHVLIDAAKLSLNGSFDSVFQGVDASFQRDRPAHASVRPLRSLVKGVDSSGKPIENGIHFRVKHVFHEGCKTLAKKRFERNEHGGRVLFL
jgi:hypothetical protein